MVGTVAPEGKVHCEATLIRKDDDTPLNDEDPDRVCLGGRHASSCHALRRQVLKYSWLPHQLLAPRFLSGEEMDLSLVAQWLMSNSCLVYVDKSLKVCRVKGRDLEAPRV